MPMFIFGMLVNQLQKGEASARRVFALVDLEPTINDKEDAKELDGSNYFDQRRQCTPTSRHLYQGSSRNIVQGKCREFLGVMGHTGEEKQPF